jgi:CheY-like chemotaxis protein
LLEQRGHAVYTAANGREALDKIERGPIPRLVILDLMMPVMNGYELREEMLRRPALAKIPVVVVSGTLDAGSARHLAVLELIAKPLNLPKLYTLVEQHCGCVS